MKRIITATLFFFAFLCCAHAQQYGCQYITKPGDVLTVAQWNFCFGQKQDALNYTPVNRAGDAMQGRLSTFASSLNRSGFAIPPGTAPSSPSDGDIWMTTAGLYARVNGATVGPIFGTSSAAALSSVNDTNVTATLSGTPGTALLQPVTVTFGWTGTLAAARLNANVVQSFTGGDVSGSIAAQAATLTVNKIHGNVLPVGAGADSQILIGSGASNFIFSTIPNCPSGVIQYTAATHTLACGSDPTNASNITSGTLNTARLPSPFTSGTTSGSTSQFASVAAGVKTAGHPATWDASGNLQDSGAAGTGTVTQVVCGQGLSGGTITTTGTCAVGLSSLSSALGANVSLNNTSAYFDGPSVGQGTTGTWLAIATLTLFSSTADNITCKLWDSVTVVANSKEVVSVGAQITMTLSGVFTTPAASIRASCKDADSVNGAIVFQNDAISKSSTLTVVRIQ